MPETPKSEPLAKDSMQVKSETDPVAQSSNHAGSDTERSSADNTPDRPPEFGGQKGPEPTRYGDWEKNGRCTDF